MPHSYIFEATEADVPRRVRVPIRASNLQAGQECLPTHNGLSVDTPQDAHSLVVPLSLYLVAVLVVSAVPVSARSLPPSGTDAAVTDLFAELETSSTDQGPKIGRDTERRRRHHEVTTIDENKPDERRSLPAI